MSPSKNALRIACTLLLLSKLCLGQLEPPPFASVDAALKNRRHWSLASSPFQAERTRLAENFEPELWKYLGADVDKQDRIANFLTYSGYLHGNAPMPDLAMRIELKSLSLLAEKSDLSSRVAFVTASINAAVFSAELELNAKAQQHKSNVDKMLAADKSLLMAVPAMEDYDNCVYDAIGDPKISSPAVACKAKKSPTDPKIAVIEIGEIPPEKIVLKPEPQWPKGAKSGSPAGPLKVQVVIDESGNVESAEALSGPSEFEEAALAAARKARFQKTMYQGDPVKVRGWLTYSN